MQRFATHPFRRLRAQPVPALPARQFGLEPAALHLQPLLRRIRLPLARRDPSPDRGFRYRRRSPRPTRPPTSPPPAARCPQSTCSRPRPAVDERPRARPAHGRVELVCPMWRSVFSPTWSRNSPHACVYSPGVQPAHQHAGVLDPAAIDPDGPNRHRPPRRSRAGLVGGDRSTSQPVRAAATISTIIRPSRFIPAATMPYAGPATHQARHTPDPAASSPRPTHPPTARRSASRRRPSPGNRGAENADRERPPRHRPPLPSMCSSTPGHGRSRSSPGATTPHPAPSRPTHRSDAPPPPPLEIRQRRISPRTPTPGREPTPPRAHGSPDPPPTPRTTAAPCRCSSAERARRRSTSGVSTCVPR